MNIILRVLIVCAGFAALAYLSGVLIRFLSRVFDVKKDERMAMLLDVLGHADCAGCGYGSCRGYADALLHRGAPVNKCTVGGNAVAATLAELLDRKYEPVTMRRAFVMCSGANSLVHFKYDYRGLQDCVSVAALGNGPKECSFGCIGLGTCVAACPFKAIKLENGVAVVEYEKCRACGVCISACPQHIIKLLPFEADVWVGCSCEDRGDAQRAYCRVGCISCGVCESSCPEGAISLTNNLARIDYDKCTNCGICVQKCPRGIIWSGGRQAQYGNTITDADGSGHAEVVL